MKNREEESGVIFGAVLFLLLGSAILLGELLSPKGLCGSSGNQPTTCYSLRR